MWCGYTLCSFRDRNRPRDLSECMIRGSIANRKGIDMGNGSYFGGGTIVNKGPYGDPGRNGIGRQPSGALKGSARMPDGVLARKIPPLRDAMSLLADLCEAGRLRLHNRPQIERYLGQLSAFDGVVTHSHRLAYDNGRRVIEEARPHIRRRLGPKHEVITKLQNLQELYS